MFKFFLFCVLFFARAANAQMAVIDTNSLAESIKQNATMAAILENGKAILGYDQRGLGRDKTDHGHGRRGGVFGADGAELYHERERAAAMRNAAVPFGRYEF